MIFSNAEKIVDYGTYIKGINQLKFDYALGKEKLKGFHYYQGYKTSRKAFEKYLREYKPFVEGIVKRILKMFTGFLKDYKYMVVLNGSFARNSYREYSDIDVSFVLEKKKTKQFIVFEELFYYALSYVLGVNRERVYSMFTRFVKAEKQKSYDDEVCFAWDNGRKISYRLTEKGAQNLYLSLCSERSYNLLLESVENLVNKDVISQMAYSYEVLFNNTQYDLESDIMAIEYHNRNNFNMPAYNIVLSNLKPAYVTRDLKTIIKDLFFEELFEFASFVRHKLVRRDNYRKLLDLNEVFESETFFAVLGKNQKTLKENYLEYLYYLTRVEMCLNRINIELSSQDTAIIDSNRLQAFYEVKFSSKEKVIQKLFNIIAQNREIYKSVLATL